MNLLRSQCMQRCDERSEAMHVTIARPLRVLCGIEAVSEEAAAAESSMLACLVLLREATLLSMPCHCLRKRIFAHIVEIASGTYMFD